MKEKVKNESDKMKSKIETDLNESMNFMEHLVNDKQSITSNIAGKAQ